MLNRLLITAIFLISFLATTGVGQIRYAQPRYLGRLAADPATCSLSAPTWYWNTATNKFKYCSAANVFSDIGGASGITTGTTTTTATTGSVLFADAGVVQQDNASLFFNNTTNVLKLSNVGGNGVDILQMVATNANYAPRLSWFYNTSTLAGSINGNFNGGLTAETPSGSFFNVGTPAVTPVTQTSGYSFEAGGTAFRINPTSATTTGQMIKLFAAQTANAFEVQPSGSSTPLMSVSAAGKATFDSTIIAPGTTGAATINKPSGRVNFAASASSLVLTNSQIGVNSHIFCNVTTNDATALSCRVTDKAAGSATVRLNAAATAETAVDFLVIN